MFLLEKDPTAPLRVFDLNAPIIDLLQEVPWTELVLDPEHAGSVKVEDAIEDVWISVKEILIVLPHIVVAEVHFHVEVCIGG